MLVEMHVIMNSLQSSYFELKTIIQNREVINITQNMDVSNFQHYMIQFICNLLKIFYQCILELALVQQTS